ncbi:MAG: DUF1385 domain-containing protein [bacterium]|jgi:uncharacterized protein YqhQ|nr:DUF1385 domain-containing protein [Bacillota bacterium]HHW55651.1 DUF1385 domain-containing protein [Bacillota bacterium]
MAKKSFGGQAVIEGVMMRGREIVAIAVRKPNREIVVHKTTICPAARRWPILKLPILRGIAALVESLSIGIGALTYSANQVAEEEEEQLGAGEMALSVVIALVLGAGLFIVLPTVLVRLLAPQAAQGSRVIYLNLLEGAFRIGIFLLYITGISLLKDIQRFFAYHGAEHKVIHAYEAGKPLTMEEILPMSPLHPRCGTAFLLYVMVVSILVFSLLGWQSLPVRILTRLALLPVVAGLAYELIRLGGRVRSPLLDLVLVPGLLLQRLTTREPDVGQIEVAVRALEAVLAEEG